MSRTAPRISFPLAVLLGFVNGFLSLAIPAFVGERLGLGDSLAAYVTLLLGLAFYWFAYAYGVCRVEPLGFDSAWPGVVGLVFPLSILCIVTFQWLEVEPRFRLGLLAMWLVGLVGAAGGVLVASVQDRPPESDIVSLAEAATSVTNRPTVWRLIGSALQTIYLVAWASDRAFFAWQQRASAGWLLLNLLAAVLLAHLAVPFARALVDMWRLRRRNRHSAKDSGME